MNRRSFLNRMGAIISFLLLPFKPIPRIKVEPVRQIEVWSIFDTDSGLLHEVAIDQYKNLHILSSQQIYKNPYTIVRDPTSK